MSGPSASPVRPGGVRVAVVGSGPAGAYAAAQLLATRDAAIEVHVFDRLPTPWGLVRAGVAPDHPKIKSVTRVFERTAQLPGFHFHGNVEVGRDVSHDELLGHFHAVLYATGAPGDRRLGIPGEELAGSHPATEFVGWYNGHPDAAGNRFDLSARRAVVVGNGNVALDVARMLALTTDELVRTDIADHALEALAGSRVEEIVVLGRRGPADATFTTPELRELGRLADCDVVVDPADLAGGAVGGTDEPFGARVGDNLEVLAGYAAREAAGHRRRIVLRFRVSPIELAGSGRVTSVRIGHNELVAPASGPPVAVPTGRVSSLDAGLVLRSVGYLGRGVPGVPFDEGTARIGNDGGRVLDPVSGGPLPGIYTAGWIKRGPSGVIGTNKKCAQETVSLLVEDLLADRLDIRSPAPAEHLLEELGRRGVDVVSHAGWAAIDAHEQALGQLLSRPRVKLVHRDQLLSRAASEARDSGARGAGSAAGAASVLDTPFTASNQLTSARNVQKNVVSVPGRVVSACATKPDT
ncbi:MAG: FAD-dependent pyridine nucleotide-disulfide oxidoreductase [Modestobacter sp.]|nr:FAD-dependent pyridine nucleotide-disulfide oxidoreductase [Modestobacter sp.]